MRNMTCSIANPYVLLIVLIGIVQGQTAADDESPTFSKSVEALAYPPLLQHFGMTTPCGDQKRLCTSFFDCCDGETCRKYTPIKFGPSVCTTCVEKGERCDPEIRSCCPNVTRCYERENKRWYCGDCKKEGEACKDATDCCLVSSNRVLLRCRTVLDPPIALPLPVNFQPGNNLPPGVNLPTGINLPPGVNLPTGINLPPGVNLPTGINFPTGIKLPLSLPLLRKQCKPCAELYERCASGDDCCGHMPCVPKDGGDPDKLYCQRETSSY